jgi:dipeptidyl aminopeptidase/acylaminoacyl peptidase
MQTLTAGTWPSPVTARSMVGGAVAISEVIPDGDDIWWAEGRPDDGGRVTVVRWRDGSVVDVTPAGSNVRTSVHEYGGGAWWVDRGAVYYVEFDDQRLRRLEPGGEPLLLTPEPSVARGLRYADGRVTPDGDWFVCVRENHEGSDRREAVNEIVAIATDGSMRIEVIATGADFYASPRVSPDGTAIVWIQWMHPNMPWDVTELWHAELAGGEASGRRRLVGNGDEALQQPEWSADGSLRVVTDRNDWWNVYRVDVTTGDLEPDVVGEFEVVEPHWVFGASRYVDGAHVIGTSETDTLSVAPDLAYTWIGSLRRAGETFVFVGASFSSEPEVARLVDGELEVVRPARPLGLADEFLPPPEFITFPTSGGATASGLYYEPAHPDVRLPAGERPPLLVLIHGGPTSAARRHFNASSGHRFWTSRGIAVVDVDYRGSTRYGRRYRNLLHEHWCDVDVEDAVAATAYLAERGDIDGERLLIRGGSAGGTTTLLALALHDSFAAGANYFGVADLVALMSDDHKFESQYSVQLIGPWPETSERYAERSPINHAQEISSPLIVLQGADDTVVPQSHSDSIVEAVAANGQPVSYLVFDGEGHGFRQADNIVRSVEAELWFYGQVLGFEPADEIEPVPITNPPG